MTSVRFYRDRFGRLCGFSAIGHAGSAPAGEDIVCAGISALTITAANALSRIAKIEVTPHVGAGFISVRLPKKMDAKRRRAASIILRTARVGLLSMAATYAEYIRVSQ